jgi:hypothetical protein
MSNRCASIHHNFVSLFVLALASVTALAGPAAAQDCQTALASSTGAVSMTNASSTSKSKGVDEWDGEVVKVVTPLPGVLEISGDGDPAQSSLYTAGDTSTHPLVDSASLSTGSRTLSAIVPAGTHCIQVAPADGSTGDFEVFATFTDVCHLSATDDHGDSFLCATPIALSGSDSGEILSATEAPDLDMFTFELTTATTVTIASTGSGHVSGTLFDSTGATVAADNAGLANSTFSLANQSLAAGRYYVQVAGAEESSYGIGVTVVSTP